MWMTDNDYKLFRSLVELTQTGLKQAMETVVKKYYKNVVSTDRYVYAKGNIPIALVAHLDTVFPLPPTDVFYDREQNVIWSPQGLGADDRAGVYIIFQILRTTKLRPHLIFTTDEEKGMLGSIFLTKKERKPFAEMKYIIQLDRRGVNDCVFYDCDNKDFTKYVESFGFKKAFGSFSDISEICPEWGIAGVNLSVGYVSEHSEKEHLYVDVLKNTQTRVIEMLKDAENAPTFEFIPDPYSYSYYYGGLGKNAIDYAYGYEWGGSDEYEVICKNCHKVFLEYETIPVKGRNGGTSFYCPDCLAKSNISWCEKCKEAFEPVDAMNDKYCVDCAKGVLKLNGNAN